MKQLINSFIQESLELLEKAEKCTLELEKNPTEDNVNDLFRSIHTIKGNSGLFNLKKVKELSHIFENVLSKLRNKEIIIDHSLVDIFLLSIDKLKQMIQNLENSENENISDLIKSLNQYLIAENQKQSILKIENKDFNFYHNEFLIKQKQLLEKAKKDNLSLLYLILEPDPEILYSEFLKKIELLKHKIYYFDFLFEDSSQNSDLATSLKKMPFIESVIINEAENLNTILEFAVVHFQKAIIFEDARNQSIKKTEFEEDAYLKISASLIEELINLAGELVIARNELLQKLNIETRELQNTGKKISYLVSQLQEKLMKTRLQKLDILFERYPRLVRDLIRNTSKDVDIEIEGGNIELDKTIIDAIRDPLTHLIRNAIDHGIETREERLSIGKPEKGKIIIKAFFQSGNVNIKISDDGRGIQLQKVLDKAIEKNLINVQEIQNLTKQEILELIFHPGLSTAEKVSETSGRGVGMDVVKNALKNIKGDIKIETETNQGTTFEILIPQTLSIVTCLLVEILGRRYAIPQSQIRELLKLDKKYLSSLHGLLVYEIRNKIIPIIDPLSFLSSHQIQSRSDYEYIILLETDEHIYGILVNQILNPEELMIKSLGDEFNEIPYYSGGTVLGDGDAILVLDVNGIAKSFSIEANRTNIEIQEKQHQFSKVKTTDNYLLFDYYGNLFGISVKKYKTRVEEIKLSDITNLIDYSAFQYNHHIVPIFELNKIFQFQEQTEIFNKKTLNVVLIEYKNSYFSLATTKILDLINTFEGIETENINNKFIEAYAIYNQKTVTLLNINSILEKFKNIINAENEDKG